jgi:uncharacterized protein (DUF885 family)
MVTGLNSSRIWPSVSGNIHWPQHPNRAQLQRKSGEKSVMQLSRSPSCSFAASGIGVLLAAGLLSACSGSVDPEGTPRRIAREVERTLTTVAQNELVRDPELATTLGLAPDAAGYPFNRFLSDRSQAAFERSRLERLETLDVLVRTSRPAQGSALARHLDAVIAAHEAAEEVLVSGHGTGDLSNFYPYVADHLRGAYLDVPELLVRQQPVETAADVDAFLSRVAQLPGALDDDRRRLEADAAAGVVPPAAVLARMQALAASGAAQAPDTSFLVQTFDNLLAGVPGMTPDERAAKAEEMRTLFTERLVPAYARFGEAVVRLTESAPAEPGVWQIEGGNVWYGAVLAAYTSTRSTPAELHARGLEDVTRLSRELDAALGAVGSTDGSIAQRLAALSQQPGQVYEDTDLGRAALIERLSALSLRARGVVESQIGAAPDTAVTVSAVPLAFAAASPSSTYTARTEDGRNPARFEVNLARITDWPDFSLSTLVFQHTLPGRHAETEAARTIAALPLARQLISNPGYGDGWAAYAETLAEENGLYTDDPLGRIGYLRSMLLRAARQVVDTGIHHQKWSRDRAIDYLVATTGISVELAAEEVDRFSAWPGEAAACWIGRQRLLDLRERAQRVLGPRFDPKAFHMVILGGGPRPLDMVEADVTRWYTEASR